jgi:hypothetical protein
MDFNLSKIIQNLLGTFQNVLMDMLALIFAALVA